MTESLLNFFSAMVEDTADMSFSSFFVVVGDSLLTTLLLCFLANWVMKICIDVGRGGSK